MNFKLFQLVYAKPEGIECYIYLFSRYVLQFPIIYDLDPEGGDYWNLQLCVPFLFMLEFSRFKQR